MKTAILSLMVMIVISLGSCTSTNKIQQAPLHSGIARTFTADYNSTLKAAREALLESGTMLEASTEVDPLNYIIIGKTRTNAWSWGEMVRVVVTKVNETETLVRVLTEKKISVNITAKGDYSNSVLSSIELKLRV